MNYYPRTQEEQEQLKRGIEELDRKMQAEEDAYWKRIKSKYVLSLVFSGISIAISLALIYVSYYNCRNRYEQADD